MRPDPKNHSVRKIVLPSGKSIEVVRFSGENEAPPSSGLHLCPDCSSDLVQPVAWSEADGERWELVLSCPNCWWEDEGIFTTPWSGRVTYRRLIGDYWPEAVCAENPTFFGTDAAVPVARRPDF